MRRRGSVVEGGKDSGGALAFDQFAHDSIVKDCLSAVHCTKSGARPTLDRRPLDLLIHILLLLRLERELDEDLLELFVDVVDTELLKRVVLEDLEATTSVSY